MNEWFNITGLIIKIRLIKVLYIFVYNCCSLSKGNVGSWPSMLDIPFCRTPCKNPTIWDLAIWGLTILGLQVHHCCLKHLSLFETFKYGITIWNILYYLNIPSLISTSFSTIERYSSLSWQYKFPCPSSVLILLKFHLNPGENSMVMKLKFFPLQECKIVFTN